MSIRSRLLFLVLLAISLPAVLVGLRFAHDREREIADAVANLSIEAERVAAALNEKILGTA